MTNATTYPMHDERGQQCGVAMGDGTFCPAFQPDGSYYCPAHDAEMLEAMAGEAEALRCSACGGIHDDAAPSPQDLEAAQLECQRRQQRQRDEREVREARRGMRRLMAATRPGRPEHLSF